MEGDARFEGVPFVGGEVAFRFGAVGPFLGDLVEIANGIEEVEEVDAVNGTAALAQANCGR